MPKAEDGGVRFIAVNDDPELRFEETVNRGDDNVEGEYDKIIFLGSPLKIMLRTNLNGSGMGKGGGDYRFVIRNVEELSGGETLVLKGSELLIGPPILVPRHYLQEPRRVGGKGTSSEL